MNTEKQKDIVDAPFAAFDAYNEKFLYVSSVLCEAQSPYFFMENRESYNVFVKNLSDEPVAARLFYSENAERCLEDGQEYTVAPFGTGIFTPSAFCKYIKLTLTSKTCPILFKVWFSDKPTL